MMVVGGLLLWLVLAPAYNSCSANGTVACGLGENVAATFVVAALAWLLWYFWTRTRLVHNYVALVRSRPEDLLGTASSGVRAAAILARVEQCEEIAEEVRNADVATQVITGPPGSGKTIFLLALARYLADRGVVPVPVSLRGAGLEVDLIARARERLLETIDDWMTYEGHGDRLWRHLRNSGRIVVLADGLDEAIDRPSVLAAPGLARRVLGASSVHGIPVVVTSRPEALPDAERAGAFSVPDVPPAEVMTRLKARANPALDTDALRRLATAADMAATPFYLEIVTKYATVDSDDRSRARLNLLTAYLQWVELGDGTHSQSSEPTARQAMVTHLAQIAYAMILNGQLSRPVDELESTLTRSDVQSRPEDVSTLVTDADELGVATLWPSGGKLYFAFRHPILQAYLAARWMQGADDEHGWARLATQRADENAFLALEMLGGIAPQAVARLVETLLDERPHGALALRRVVAAINAARLGGQFDAVAQPAYAAVKERWPQAPEVDRIGAVSALAEVGSDAAFREIWDRAIDDNYPVKWSTVEAFGDRPDKSFSALKSRFRDLIEEGRRWVALASTVNLTRQDAASDARRRFEPRLSHVAMCLPGLADCMQDPDQQTRATRMLTDVRKVIIGLTHRELALGAESALAARGIW